MAQTSSILSGDTEGIDTVRKNMVNVERKYQQGFWCRILPRGSIPCPRSLHAGCVYGSSLYVFGGYDGQQRCNDLYRYNFQTNCWTVLDVPVITPSRRDRHSAVIYGNLFVVFGGFDGRFRVNDIHAFDLDQNVWQEIDGPLYGVRVLPTPRHSHSAVVYGQSFYIFGGYDGSYCGDFHQFNFINRTWSSVVVLGGEPPSPRYRSTCVVRGENMVLHGGHDGNRHLNDTFIFNFPTSVWSLLATEGLPPSPRDSHVAVLLRNSMFIFGGSTGGALGDLHELDLDSLTWSPVLSFLPSTNTVRMSACTGRRPVAERMSVAVDMTGHATAYGVHGVSRVVDEVPIVGGMAGLAVSSSASASASATTSSIVTPQSAVAHTSGASSSGSGGGSPWVEQHEEETDSLGMAAAQRTAAAAAAAAAARDIVPGVGLGIGIGIGIGTGAGTGAGAVTGTAPSSYSSHISGQIDTAISGTLVPIANPGCRFCHIAVIYDGSLFTFGGYDGLHRLNDFLKFTFISELPAPEIPSSSLVVDMKHFVNNDMHSDVTFVVEGHKVPAHKILCMRCPYFHNMLTGEFMESRATEVAIEDVKYETFVLFLEYMYSDHVELTTADVTMDLFQVADRFGVERLKKICEGELVASIKIDNAAQILLAADAFNAERLRERCLNYIVNNFDEVSKTPCFEEMARLSLDLVLEILRLR